MKSIKKIILLTSLLVVLGSLNMMKAQAQPQILLEFQSVIKQLKNQTEVPYVLPTKVLIPIADYSGNPTPAINYEEISLNDNDRPPEFYPFLDEYSSSTRYLISLDIVPDCYGANACDFGYLIGEKITEETPKVPEEYSYQVSEWETGRPTMRSPESPTLVPLANGISGWFIPFVCGANCASSQIIWDLNGYRYTIGIDMASKEALTEMANSAILNQ